VVGEYVKVETQARLEGRNMSMVLSPDRKALDARKAAGIAPPEPVTEAELEAAEVDPDDLAASDVTGSERPTDLVTADRPTDLVTADRPTDVTEHTAP
jgi:hypothetical protein